MIVDKACFERGCACYDDRVDGPGVEVVKKEWVGLTDEEIADLWSAQIFHITDLKLAKDFVRDIEAAHNIKGEA